MHKILHPLRPEFCLELGAPCPERQCAEASNEQLCSFLGVFRILRVQDVRSCSGARVDCLLSRGGAG